MRVKYLIMANRKQMIVTTVVHLSLLLLSVLCESTLSQLSQSQQQPPPPTANQSNDTYLLSGIWNSLTTVGKTASCPGECLHAITSIFCDNVLEEISCGESFLRCCVSNQLSYATTNNDTSIWSSDTESTSTIESFSVISNNHNSSLTNLPPQQTSTTESTIPSVTFDNINNNNNNNNNNVWSFETVISPVTTPTVVPITNVITTTTTPINITTESTNNRIDQANNNEVIADQEPESGRNSYSTCPIPCSRLSPNVFCLKPIYNAHCDAHDHECCLETESTIDTMTRNLIKLVQQSVALNETKNIGTELSALSAPISPVIPTTTPTSNDTIITTTTTLSPLPECDGTCVVSLFSILCDEIDSTQYCPNGGSCCVNREPTTATPPISACDGTCIPVILSGMCNKPYELVLKTIDCAPSTICCADKKSSDSSMMYGASDDSAATTGDDFEPPPSPPKDNIHYHPQLNYPHNTMIEAGKPQLPSTYMGRPVMRPLPQPPPSPPLSPANIVNHPYHSNYHGKPNPYLVNTNPAMPMPIPPHHPAMKLPGKPKPLNAVTFGVHHNAKPDVLPFHGANTNSANGQPIDPQTYKVPPPHLMETINGANNNKIHSVARPMPLPDQQPQDVRPMDDKKPPLAPINKFPCPGSCINSMFRFTCFGSSAIYNGFHCAKSQVCCAPIVEIEKFEAFLHQTSVSQTTPKPMPNTNINLNNNNNNINNNNNKGNVIGVYNSPESAPLELPIESNSPDASPPHVCGIKGTSGNRNKRVVGGSDSNPGEWCWQVALVNQHNKYICGGALIGRQWVLTAAHCITNLVRKNEVIFVRFGEYDLTLSNRLGVKVVTHYIHHNHNGQSLDNDIALLKLQSAIELNDDVCLVCLPTRRAATQSPKKRCTVTGYGFENESGPIALRVRQASVPIVEDQLCTTRINSVTERQFILPASSFCAGGEGGNDACQGDGGSGLVCESEGFYELTGLVSWGFGCGRNGVPGVYVKVSSFVGWVNQIVSTNSN